MCNCKCQLSGRGNITFNDFCNSLCTTLSRKTKEQNTFYGSILCCPFQVNKSIYIKDYNDFREVFAHLADQLLFFFGRIIISFQSSVTFLSACISSQHKNCGVCPVSHISQQTFRNRILRNRRMVRSKYLIHQATVYCLLHLGKIEFFLRIRCFRFPLLQIVLF